MGPVINNSIAAYIKSYSTNDAILNEEKESLDTVRFGIQSSRINTIINARKENIQSIIKVLSLLGVNIKDVSAHVNRIVADAKSTRIGIGSATLGKKLIGHKNSTKEAIGASVENNNENATSSSWLSKYMSNNSESNILYNRWSAKINLRRNF